ncbi:hypothetical protein SAMN06272735_3373 [Streptomyces sp. TLI_55]|uniref:hypothetical protein n=1 Tax=Streptomyces sp. TLI_55 TaxID=1938861 RepID=UPI000BD84FA4|nr:hypothetical protein [Streptomyces sp. TLI_55]SNX61630.1 hypothetical protein SAMN06272735_3373 [Streptomyces sp. TLI_55]
MRGRRVAERGWDDDSEYRRAVGRAWGMVALASCCSLLVVALVVLAVLGAGVFVFLVEALGG